VRAAACQRRLSAGISDETDRYNTLMDLGRAFYDQERYAEALKNYQAAVEVDGNYFGAYQMIGRVNLDQGKAAEARDALDKAVSLDPQQSDSLFYRGAAKRRLGDFDSALDDVEAAVKMNPDQPDYAGEVGLLLLSKGKIAAAVAEADRAALLEPDGFMIASMFAYYLGGRSDDALAMVDRALNAGSSWAYWWIWKAMIQRGSGDDLGAVATLADAQQKFSDWPRPVIDFMAGKIDAAALRRAGQTGTAYEQKQRRCEIEFYIGAQAAAAGDKVQARAAFQQALETRIYEYIEYMVAPAFLASLEPG
jgi:tetratricopeptide (TPR) repeat protein